MKHSAGVPVASTYTIYSRLTRTPLQQIAKVLICNTIACFETPEVWRLPSSYIPSTGDHLSRRSEFGISSGHTSVGWSPRFGLLIYAAYWRAPDQMAWTSPTKTLIRI